MDQVSKIFIAVIPLQAVQQQIIDQLYIASYRCLANAHMYDIASYIIMHVL